jgi:hypothetical protein
MKSLLYMQYWCYEYLGLFNEAFISDYVVSSDKMITEE